MFCLQGKSFASYHGLHPLLKTNDNQEEKSALVERELASSAGFHLPVMQSIKGLSLPYLDILHV
jgi:hypothetical protein